MCRFFLHFLLFLSTWIDKIVEYGYFADPDPQPWYKKLKYTGTLIFLNK
jgi:hypothetical protein